MLKRNSYAKGLNMSTLVFQIHIKRWDKSQRSTDDVAKRQALPVCSTIKAKAEFFILDKKCLIDIHSTGAHRELKKSLLKNGSVKLERFIINEKDGKTSLSYQEDNQEIIEIGDLNQGWIQAKYNWRYSVEQDNEIFWLYEEVTLNAACIEEFGNDYFLKNKPKLCFDAPIA